MHRRAFSQYQASSSLPQASFIQQMPAITKNSSQAQHPILQDLDFSIHKKSNEHKSMHQIIQSHMDQLQEVNENYTQYKLAVAGLPCQKKKRGPQLQFHQDIDSMYKKQFTPKQNELQYNERLKQYPNYKSPFQYINSSTHYQHEYPAKQVNQVNKIVPENSIKQNNSIFNGNTQYCRDYTTQPHARDEPIKQINNLFTANLSMPHKSLYQSQFVDFQTKKDTMNFKPIIKYQANPEKTGTSMYQTEFKKMIASKQKPCQQNGSLGATNLPFQGKSHYQQNFTKHELEEKHPCEYCSKYHS